jgi:hypothetical protein
MYPRTPPLALTALALVACQGTPVDGEALSLVYGERVYASGDPPATDGRRRLASALTIRSHCLRWPPKRGSRA